MGEMISHTIEGQAFLGAMAETENAKKVEWVANNMVNVLHFRPSNDEDKKKASNYSSEMINGLGFKVDTVNNLKLVEDDDRKTPGQKEIARENLEILAKGTFLAMQKSMDTEAMDLLGQGSAVEIDNFLPDPLKGLGEKVVKNIINNEKITEVLKELDQKTEEEGWKLMPPTKEEEKSLLSQSARKLARLDSIIPEGHKDRDQLVMVASYMQAKLLNLNEETGTLRGEEKVSREVPPSILPQLGKDAESSQTGALDTYMALHELPPLKGTSHEQIAEWVFKATDRLTRGSLFWAGSAWQQIGPYLERQIEMTFAGDKGENIETRKSKERMFMQAVVACRMQEQAIIHCDGDPNSYSELLPPPGKMTDYLWRDTTVKLVEGGVDGGEKGTIEGIRRYLRQMAYDKKLGVAVAKGLKNPNEINIWAEKIASDLVSGVSYKDKADKDVEVRFSGNESDYGKEMARVGIALFIVEDYARWAMWSCKKSVEDEGLKEVPWMKIDPEKEGDIEAPNKSAVWSQRVMNNSGKKDWVQIWGSDFPKSSNSTCVQHPYCQFMRPVDLYRYKSSWNEEILAPLEETLSDLAIRKWLYKDDGTKFKDGHVENMLRPSEVTAKDFNRWNAVVSAWMGGTQADSLDNFKDWLKGAEQLKALLQNRTDVLDFGGEIAGDVFYHKTRAFMSMQKDDFLKALSIALGGDIYEVKEIQAFKGDLLGSTGIGEFGQLFESIKRINLNMDTKRFDQAMAMLQTGVNNPEKAEKLLKVKKAAIVAQGIMNTLGGMAGQKKR